MAVLARVAAAARGRGRLSVRQAVVLGLVQGPTEVLPVSSSGHLVLVPALLGWPYARLSADVRKTFEVALHMGAGLALALLLREDVVAALRSPRSTALLTAPAAVVALAFEDAIEEHVSRPEIAAAAMVAGGVGLAAADAGRESAERAGAVSEFCVGAAQAAALVPGVSRNGATLTAARALGFDREASARLSWRAGLPIIGGATVLKAVRLSQRGLEPELRAPFTAGAAAAFLSTLAASPLLRIRKHRGPAIYRIAFGSAALLQLRTRSGARMRSRRPHRLQWPRG